MGLGFKGCLGFRLGLEFRVQRGGWFGVSGGLGFRV